MTDSSAVLDLGAAAFGRKVAALLAVQSAHLPRVLDVTALGERRQAELEAVPGPSLAELLALRRRVTAGEAVTIMVGVVRAVAALHAAGYCGVRVSEATVRLTTDGRPVVLGLDELREVIQSGAAGCAEDWSAVGSLADRLGLMAHGRAAGALGPAQLGLGLALASVAAGESEQSLERLEAALFEITEPAPVRLDAAPAPAAHEGPAPSPLAASRRAAAHRRPSSSVLIEAFDAGPAAILAGPLERGRARVSELLGRVHGRGRLLIIAGGAAIALILVALAALPDAAPRAGVVRAAAVTAAATATATAMAGGSPPASPAADSRLTGPDPIAAAVALLTERDGCLTAGAAQEGQCLARVADGEASALEQPARPLAGLTPSLLERTGDSALVALTPKDPDTAPASALLMRTEAGWRLRQLYEN